MREETRATLISWIVGVVFIGLLFYVFIGLAIHDDERRERCEAKGGTYLHDNGVCLDVKSIPVER